MLVPHCVPMRPLPHPGARPSVAHPDLLKFPAIAAKFGSVRCPRWMVRKKEKLSSTHVLCSNFSSFWCCSECYLWEFLHNTLESVFGGLWCGYLNEACWDNCWLPRSQFSAFVWESEVREGWGGCCTTHEEISSESLQTSQRTWLSEDAEDGTVKDSTGALCIAEIVPPKNLWPLSEFQH